MIWSASAVFTTCLINCSCLSDMVCIQFHLLQNFRVKVFHDYVCGRNQKFNGQESRIYWELRVWGNRCDSFHCSCSNCLVTNSDGYCQATERKYLLLRFLNKVCWEGNIYFLHWVDEENRIMSQQIKYDSGCYVCVCVFVYIILLNNKLLVKKFPVPREKCKTRPPYISAKEGTLRLQKGKHWTSLSLG